MAFLYEFAAVGGDSLGAGEELRAWGGLVAPLLAEATSRHLPADVGRSADFLLWLLAEGRVAVLYIEVDDLRATRLKGFLGVLLRAAGRRQVPTCGYMSLSDAEARGRVEGILHSEGFENGGQLLARCLPSLRPGQAWTPGDVVGAFKREILRWRRRAYGAPCTAAVERLDVNEIMHSWVWTETRRWR